MRTIVSLIFVFSNLNAFAGNGSGTMNSVSFASVSESPRKESLGQRKLFAAKPIIENEKTHICWARGTLPEVGAFNCEGAEVILNADVERNFAIALVKCPGAPIQMTAHFTPFRTGGNNPIKGIQMEVVVENTTLPKGKQLIAAMYSKVGNYTPEIIATEFRSDSIFLDFACYRK